MSDLEEFWASATVAAGAAVATWAEWEQQAEHPDGALVFALFASGGVGLLALAMAAAGGARIVRAAARPAPEPVRRRPAPGTQNRPAPAVLLRPPSRHGADRTPPGEDIHYFKPGRRYAAFERGNGWGL